MEAGQVARLLILLTLLEVSASTASAGDQSEFSMSAPKIGLLINFSVPCDLDSKITIPDAGGLLTPVLLAVGYQVYKYDGAEWVYVDQAATLYNKTLAKVGRLFGASKNQVTFELAPSSGLENSALATVTADPLKSVSQRFSIPLQLLAISKTTNISSYSSASYVQRFGTQTGLPPSKNYPAKVGDKFYSRFSAFYAFFLPFRTSPQLATRVPRCGDERFYGIQFQQLQ